MNGVGRVGNMVESSHAEQAAASWRIEKKHLHSKHSYSELMCGMLPGSEGLNSYTDYVKQHQEKLIYYIDLFFIIY